MTDFYTLASTRRSIRKFTDEDIKVDEVIDCVKTAVTAPSGCDSQCWRFVIIHDKATLTRMAEAVMAKSLELFTKLGISDDSTYLSSKNRMTTFFTKAPVCVAVFLTEMDYYDKRFADAWKSKGHDVDEMMRLYGQPDLLSIGAAIQNLLLALHEKNLGGCWMNDPVIAGAEINAILGIPAEHPLISLVAVGHPAYAPRPKKYKPMEEILKVIG